MVYVCAVSGCSKSAEKHVRTLHEFPTPRKDSLATVNAWRQFVRRTRADWKGVTKWSRICSEHFEEKCYVNWTAWRMKAADKLHLRTDQVPTRCRGSIGVRPESRKAVSPRAGGGAMSASWRDEEEELRARGARGPPRSKPRFSFNELKLLLEAVKRNRNIVLKKFNHGVSSELKKQTWAEITDQVNALGENQREMRQIMKKWADLKCDGKRRIAALRGPDGAAIRKKTLGPVERMVQDILVMSPRGDGESEPDLDADERLSKLHSSGSSSYLNLTDSAYSLGGALDMSPLSSPDKDDAFQSSSEFDLDAAEEGESVGGFAAPTLEQDPAFPCPDPPPPSAFTEPLSDEALRSVRPFHTYSRPPAGPSTSSAIPDGGPASSAAASPATSQPSASAPPPAAPSSASSDPLPAGGATRRQRLFQVASQSLQQQQASRLLLGSVSQSLEALAQSVQLLVETQQEFVQESLMLQRQTVDILRDFSSTALTVLRDKTGTGQTRL